MNSRKLIPTLEIVLFSALFIFTGYGMYLGSQGQRHFPKTFVSEDGLVENLTALVSFFCKSC